MGTLLAIFLVYILYFLFTVSKYDKTGHYKKIEFAKDIDKLNKKEKEKILNKVKEEDFKHLPNEVKFFVIKYKIDLEKINIRAFLKMNGLLLSLVIAVAILFVMIVFNNKDIYVGMLVGIVLTIVLYLIALKLLAIYFKKKGLVKDE